MRRDSNEKMKRKTGSARADAYSGADKKKKNIQRFLTDSDVI